MQKKKMMFLTLAAFLLMASPALAADTANIMQQGNGDGASVF